MTKLSLAILEWLLKWKPHLPIEAIEELRAILHVDVDYKDLP